MKALLLMLFAGSGLFTGTVVGLLALQGRLNFDGTRGLPVIEHMFDGPAEGDAELAPAPPPVGPAQSPSELPRAMGPSVAPGEPAGADSAPAGAEPAATGPETGETAHAAPAEPPLATATGAASDPMPPRLGQAQYRRGHLFNFPSLESGMTVEELDQLAGSVQQLREELTRREAAVEQRAAEIGAREADLQERERTVLARMREVLQERSKLEEEIASFQQLYTLVRRNEHAQYQTWAERMAALSPDQASAIFLQLWATEEGKTKAVKILKLMPREAADEVFAQLTPEQAHAILDRLAATAVEEPKQ